METTQIDFIIVGQGIAGTFLSYFLQKNNQKIIVVDEENEFTSSKVAGGVYNPIVFKRLVKSWRADELIPFLENFYPEIEKELNIKIFNKKHIVKLFTNIEEREFWQKKAKEQIGANYLEQPILEEYSTFIKSKNFGYALLNSSGYVNLVTLLSTFRNKLKQENNFICEKIKYEELIIEDNFVKWKNYKAKKIIFCEGYKAINNPFTPFCKLKPVKGDVLTITSNELAINDIINKTVSILPIKNNQFKIGSTYNWNFENELPQEKEKQELANNLNQLINTPYSIIKHESGIRPSSFDRRPILGLHPKHKTVAVFNGLGAKGVMLGPFFAKQFSEYLLFNKEIDNEVNVKRFFN